MKKETAILINKVYEYLRDTLTPMNGCGNIHYCNVCDAIGNDLTPLELVEILHILISKGKVNGFTSTYAAYIVLK